MIETSALKRLVLGPAAGLLALCAAGCAHVPVYDQKEVSKSGMTFSDSLLASDEVNAMGQLESGRAVSGGAQSAGCTACR